MRDLILSIMMLFAFQASNCRRDAPKPEARDLITLVKEGKPNAVQACLDQGADPNVPDAYGTPPLHWACCYDKEGRIINALLKAGARIDIKDKDGWIPLDWAFRESNRSAIKQLIQKAIELRKNNLRGHDGKTLLHYAVGLEGEEGRKIVGQLLALGLDPNVKDRRGYTPLNYDTNNHIKVQLLLAS